MKFVNSFNADVKAVAYNTFADVLISNRFDARVFVNPEYVFLEGKEFPVPGDQKRFGHVIRGLETVPKRRRVTSLDTCKVFFVTEGYTTHI